MLTLRSLPFCQRHACQTLAYCAQMFKGQCHYNTFDQTQKNCLHPHPDDLKSETQLTFPSVGFLQTENGCKALGSNSSYHSPAITENHVKNNYFTGSSSNPFPSQNPFQKFLCFRFHHGAKLFPKRLSRHPLFGNLSNIPCQGHPVRSASPTRVILESSPSTWQPYLRLIRFDKPIGTWLLYWPCTWSIALAMQPGSLPDLKMLALFGIGAFFMRGAGCIINDMWDKDFDIKVARTRDRPLACGQLSRFQALLLLGAHLSISLGILLQLNWYTVALGVSSMALVIAYPLAKRFTYWPQVVLGMTFNYGALMGWSAIQEGVDWSVCLPLYMSCALWTLVYDTIYAHQDKEDDLLIGVKSTALLLGDQTKPWLAGFTSLMTGGLLTCGFMNEMTWPFYIGVGLVSTRLAQQIYTINLDNHEECATAFKSNFYIGIALFLSIVTANLIKPKDEKSPSQEPLPVTT